MPTDNILKNQKNKKEDIRKLEMRKRKNDGIERKVLERGGVCVLIHLLYDDMSSSFTNTLLIQLFSK